MWKVRFQMPSSLKIYKLLVMNRFFLIIVLLQMNISFAQENKKVDQRISTLENFSNYFLGQWKSDPEACIGIGKATREYQWILDSAYIYSSTNAEFISEDKVSDTHKDWSIFSYDNLMQKMTLREFHSEGYIIKYVIEGILDDQKTITFLSDIVENTPKGWKVRLIIEIINEDSFDEFFDLAEPQGDFKTYVKGRWLKQ